MVMTDAAGTIVLVNIATEQLLGYHRDELIGKSVELLVPPRVRGTHAGLRRAFHGHSEISLDGQRP